MRTTLVKDHKNVQVLYETRFRQYELGLIQWKVDSGTISIYTVSGKCKVNVSGKCYFESHQLLELRLNNELRIDQMGPVIVILDMMLTCIQRNLSLKAVFPSKVVLPKSYNQVLLIENTIGDGGSTALRYSLHSLFNTVYTVCTIQTVLHCLNTV